MKFEGFKPYPTQRKVINSIIGSNELYHTIVCGRQSGKSTTLLGLILYYSINNAKSATLYIAPTYGQISKIQTQIIDTLEPTGIIVTANKASYEIKLANGSLIYFRSAERADNIRGLAVDYLLCDESQDLKTDGFQKSILPTITARGKKCILAGTPKTRNFFYEYYQMGKSSDYSNYKSYNFPSWESPYVSNEFIEEAKKSLPEKIFQQEFAAEFIEDDGVVFKGLGNVLINDNWPDKTRGMNIYAALDVGTKDDYAVLTFVDELGRVLYVWRDRHMAYSDIVDKVVSLCKKFSVKDLLVESNGAGDVLYEEIKKKWRRVTPLFQTHSSKENIIRRLMSDIEDINIELPSDKLFEPLANELSIFQYEVMASGKIKYGAPSGFHDDCVMSLAMANWHRLNSKKGNGIKIGGLR